MRFNEKHSILNIYCWCFATKTFRTHCHISLYISIKNLSYIIASEKSTLVLVRQLQHGAYRGFSVKLVSLTQCVVLRHVQTKLLHVSARFVIFSRNPHSYFQIYLLVYFIRFNATASRKNKGVKLLHSP